MSPDATHDRDLIAGRYRRLRSIGVGAMGEVWLAEDHVLERTVAVKQIRVDRASTVGGDVVARMMREARTAAKLHHRNIVSVFDLQTLDDHPCVIMEFVDGENLAQRIDRVGALPPDEVAKIIADVATGLAFAHQRQVVHRDVKPANILIDAEGNAKLADFGIARGAGDLSLTQTGHMIGTMAFMAPEIARGEPATAAGDIWSLGATMFAAAEGRAPFADSVNSAQMLLRLVSEAAPALTRVDQWSELAAQMMATDAAERPTAAAVARLLAEHPLAVGRSYAPTVELGPTPKDPPAAALVAEPVAPEPTPVRGAPGATEADHAEPATRIRPAGAEKPTRAAGRGDGAAPGAPPRRARRRRRVLVAALSIAVLAAALTTAVLLNRGTDSTVSASTTDPVGDVRPAGTTASVDIVGLDATVKGSTLTVTVDLAAPYDPIFGVEVVVHDLSLTAASPCQGIGAGEARVTANAFARPIAYPMGAQCSEVPFGEVPAGTSLRFPIDRGTLLPGAKAGDVLEVRAATYSEPDGNGPTAAKLYADLAPNTGALRLKVP